MDFANVNYISAVVSNIDKTIVVCLHLIVSHYTTKTIPRNTSHPTEVSFSISSFPACLEGKILDACVLLCKAVASP
jgi:hypothetical protein